MLMSARLRLGLVNEAKPLAWLPHGFKLARDQLEPKPRQHYLWENR